MIICVDKAEAMVYNVRLVQPSVAVYRGVKRRWAAHLGQRVAASAVT